ncbi:hypothetical protein [Brucella intermedia]|uniref:hypothetical protein n=1 Tax=Brucella intermedia TaxID=94625 RepID=UPI00224B167E|nr:hypothetical protein [Brucella intermedia]
MMAFRMKIDGVEKKCMRIGGVLHGYEKVLVFNDEGQPEAEHKVPKDWLDIDARGIAVTGGHQYELVR